MRYAQYTAGLFGGRHMKTRAREGGFTLVEIAIVLVIIGLLLGGILKGQELITSARVRNLADQGAAVQAAYYGFVDRYHAIPGDMLKSQVCGAIGTVPGWTGYPLNGPGGNGDSNILNFAEAAAVWAHLTGARFLQGSYTGTATTEPTYIATPNEQAPRNPWNVYFGPLKLGRLLEEHMRIEDANGSSSAEIQSPLKAISARRSHSHLEGPVGSWITSLLPTGSPGLRCGYVDNLPVAHIPTAL